MYVPNEFFEEFKNEPRFKTSKHMAFAFSYTYLMHWFYRFAKYFNTQTALKTKFFKEILGYSPNNKEVNYIIKKNGLLEDMKILETDTDAPVMAHYDNIDNDVVYYYVTPEDDTLSHTMSYHKDYGYNLEVKYPIRGFNRYPNDPEWAAEYPMYQDGTFHDVNNTTKIPFDVFIYCMTNKDIGCIGFYIYCYILHMNQYYNNSWDVPYSSLGVTGIKLTTAKKYIMNLRSYNMVTCTPNQKYYVSGMWDEDRKANSYDANDFKWFWWQKQFVRKMPTMEYEKYLEIKEAKKMVNEGMSDLPF